MVGLGCATGGDGGRVTGVETPGFAELRGEGGMVGDEVEVAGEGEVGLVFVEKFGEIRGAEGAGVVAGKRCGRLVVEDEPGGGGFAAEFLAFAPECGHGAGMGGFAFVEGERGDDDRACEGLDNA